MELMFWLKLLAGVIAGIIAYFLKKRLDKIDTLDSQVNALQNKFVVLEEKLITLETTNLPLLMAIKEELGDVKAQLGVVQSEIKYLQRHTDRQDNKIDEMTTHYRRRRTDDSA